MAKFACATITLAFLGDSGAALASFRTLQDGAGIKNWPDYDEVRAWTPADQREIWRTPLDKNGNLVMPLTADQLRSFAGPAHRAGGY